MLSTSLAVPADFLGCGEVFPTVVCVMVCGFAAAVIVVVVDIAFLFGAAVGFALDFIVHGLLRIIMVSGHSGMDSDISI